MSMNDCWATHPGCLLQGQVNRFQAPWVPLSELAIALPVVVFSLLQRKSSKAKEKKQKRLEERAAMDAVCAKVDAANRVTLSSSLNFSFFLFFTSWRHQVADFWHCPHRPVLTQIGRRGCGWLKC